MNQSAEYCDVGGMVAPPPCTMVIFGGSGDLTRRKLLPSLYNMAREGFLNEKFAVIGTGSTPLSDDDFRTRLREGVEEMYPGAIDKAVLDRLAASLYYVRGRFTKSEEFPALKKRLEEVGERHGTEGNVLYYLAIPPQSFGDVADNLGKVGLVHDPLQPGPWTRLIIEKPFGDDLESAQELNRRLAAVFHERQIHRIDHYLGKETVQNILLFRFTNGIFEPVWNRRYVDHVQITVAEKLGVEGRGAFYDHAGSLRDVMQNHMFQLLCLVAMEPPNKLEAEAVRSEKVKVLDAIHPMSPAEIDRFTVRGQYGPGTVDGKAVPGYRQEPSVSPTSNIDTFSAVRLEVENWRWAGVPFYLRTGKRLPVRDTEIVVQFRQAPLMLLDGMAARQPPNRLTIHVQPDERITLRFHAKCPGPPVRLAPVQMEFKYSELDGKTRGTGYETLLYDCMMGDRMLFHRADMVESAWRIATPILKQWESQQPKDFPNYPAGTWGPPAAEELIQRDGHRWFGPDDHT
ncbi:MAG TPA: glucose-6-phosphate dehydrogenase [Candidatus Binatia bacterium]|nr:glucose-6-phosphate dehydrogenase [Candidatus Binatia bacterium]